VNALPASELGNLCVPGYPLVVMYDPNDPERSRLHESDPDPVVAATLLAFGSGMLLLIYCVKGYPAWKERRRSLHG
jgi:hypothetical protein